MPSFLSTAGEKLARYLFSYWHYRLPLWSTSDKLCVVFSNLNGHLSTLLDEALFANYISCCPILIGNQSQGDRFQWKGRFLPQSQATDVLHSTTLLQQLYIKSTTILNPTQQVYINSPSIQLLYNNCTTILKSLLLQNFLGPITSTFRKLGSVTFNAIDNPGSNHYCNGGMEALKSVLQSFVCILQTQHFDKMVNWTCTSC